MFAFRNHIRELKYHMGVQYTQVCFGNVVNRLRFVIYFSKGLTNIIYKLLRG